MALAAPLRDIARPQGRREPHAAAPASRPRGSAEPARCSSVVLARGSSTDALKQFLEECKFRNVSLEHKYWDKARVGEEKTRRVPDILATHPTSGREYVIDCRIFWNPMSDSSSGGYASYTYDRLRRA